MLQENPEVQRAKVDRSIRDLRVKLLVQDILYGDPHEEAEAEAKMKEMEKE